MTSKATTMQDVPVCPKHFERLYAHAARYRPILSRVVMSTDDHEKLSLKRNWALSSNHMRKFVPQTLLYRLK